MGGTMAPDYTHGLPRRPIKRLLVANRGEIAKRIIDCARELTIETFALVTASDTSHALSAAHILPIASSASYLDIDSLIEISKQHKVDAVHPGYGFLSESADFAQRMWTEAGVIVVGPGWDILRKTGHKLAAKSLAQGCKIPTLPAMEIPILDLEGIRNFVKKAGYPVMLKAVDGGGGKGIRLVRQESDLENAMKRAIAESPSHRIFVEKAVVDGFRHIEVQIIGDGSGEVRHLWERECSIQRRYQKIIEQAPSTIKDRAFVGKIIEAAINMARNIQYLSLGTFEFLANADRGEFFFLEVNPRLQVEHTVTECIALVDLVKIQLEIAQGASLAETELKHVPSEILQVPKLHSIQLRLTAEDPQRDWTLSIGKVEAFSLPTGHGVRIDTHLTHRQSVIIGADFDSLLAKIIVTGGNQHVATSKCRRALDDSWIGGVKTNIDILRAIVAHNDFALSSCDTSWLERNINKLLPSAVEISRGITNQQQEASRIMQDEHQAPSQFSNGMGSTVLLRKGDAWALKLTTPRAVEETHHIKLTRVVRNEFPSSFKADIEYTHANSRVPQTYNLEATGSNASSASVVAAGRHRRGDANNPLHVVVPFPGKLVELRVDEGDEIQPGQVVCVVQQMKMELEIRANRGGRVKWVTEAQDGEDIAEGTLAVELEDLQNADRAKALL
ncbi:PycA protein [Xylaria arbuscula]|nr:PycA protein [Xylaria arbuscula]